MEFPVVHKNGTSKGHLFQANLDAVQAIDEAILKVSMACPNGRDYYFRDGSIRAAMCEHADRLNQLQSVKNELMEIVEKIDEQEA